MSALILQIVRKRYPWIALVLVALCVGVWSYARPRGAVASVPYLDPFYTNASSNAGCICESCGCERPSEWVQPGVSVLSGELGITLPVWSTPGMLASFDCSLLYRSMISGRTEFGKGVIPSYLHTVKKVVVNPLYPNSSGGHEVYWRRPDGKVAKFTWSGSTYTCSDCGVLSKLTTNGSNNYVITDPWGGTRLFASNGMPDTYTDPNGNTTVFTTNSSYQVTAIQDSRGQTTSLHHDSAGYADYADTPQGRFYFVVNGNGVLTSITTPSTPDQSSGITTTLSYDGSDRLTGVQNGNGDTPFTYSYVSTTDQIDHATGSTISFSYGTGYTDVTDRNSNVHRYEYSGANITKVGLRVSGAWQFATEYRYNGNDVVTTVFPRGNRIDYTRDGNGNMTERRRKTTDTSTNSSTNDIVESWTYSSYNYMTSYTDPLGNTTTYVRTKSGTSTSTDDCDSTGTKGRLYEIQYPNVSNPSSQNSVTQSFNYNGLGQQTKQTDEEGKVTTSMYFDNSTSKYGLPKETHVDPNGLNIVTSTNYDSSFHVSTVTAPGSRVTTYSIDALGRTTNVQDPGGVDTQFHYDGVGQVVEKDVENLDKDGTSVSANPWITTTYTYSVHGNLLSITEEIDASNTRTTSFDYDANDNRIRVTKPEGNKDYWTYNSHDLVATHVRGETSSVASTDTYSYDDNGNLTGLQDGRGNSTTYTVDLFDRRWKTTDPTGAYEEIDISKRGETTEVRRKDSSNNTLQRSTRSFDERGRLWQVSDLMDDPSSTTYADAVTTYARFKTGEVYTVTNPRGKTTTYAIDNAHRVTSITDPMGNVTSNTYNSSGERTAWSIAEVDSGSTVTHEYEESFDARGLTTSTREVDRTNGSHKLETAYSYDSRGNLLFVVNAMGNPTRYTFDGLSRMTKKEVALTIGGTINDFSTSIDTQWGYDRNNRLVSFKDDAGHESTWSYDAKDRPTVMTYPDSSACAYLYDACDNLTQTTDAAGNIFVDTFSSRNLSTARAITLTTGFSGTTSESRSYDALGRLISASDDDYTVDFTYTVIGLRSLPYSETQSYATGSANSKTVTKGYDANGNMTAEAYPSGSGMTLTRVYNDIDQESQVTDGTNSIASWTFIGSRPKVVTFGNGTTQTNTYRGFRDEIGTIEHKQSGGTTLLRLDYGYNDIHDRTYERYGASGSSGDAFEYDKAQRLTKAWMGSSTPSSPSGNTYVKSVGPVNRR